MFRKLAAFAMLVIVPASLVAADSGVAMMYAYGPASLNGSAVLRSSAIFPGDRVQTNGNSVAKINAQGVNVAVMSDSAVKFENGSVSLDRGTVSVSTSKGTAARVGAVTITPTSQALTEFQVTQAEGKVMVLARKGDVGINDAGKLTTLAQGTRTTRYADSKGGGAAPAAGGGILDSPIAIGIGAAAVAGLVTWVLVQGSDPASPVKP